MKKYTLHSGFTLIELIVAISIFAVMMISVLSIFLFSSQMSTRVELNRVMQENIKNVVEDITENVRTGGVEGLRDFGGSCEGISGGNFISSDGLCLQGGNEYVVGTYDEISDAWVRIDDSATFCSEVQSECRILKREGAGEYFPLTNSFIHFERLEFVMSNEALPKLTMNFSVRPSYRKGLSFEIIENSTLHLQTTVSERLIETN